MTRTWWSASVHTGTSPGFRRHPPQFSEGAQVRA
jgi:hypothetical protein